MNPAIHRQTKGESTRAQILEAAVSMASEGGFESLTIGSLAEKTGLSKSGLFAHFGSRVELQLAALDEAARRFTESVFLPALKAPRGLERLRALVRGWLDWTARAGLPGGCPLDAATQEFTHWPGPLRDAVIERQKNLGREVTRTVQMAIDTGELAAGADAPQMAFELYATVLAYYRMAVVFGPEVAHVRANTAFDRILESAKSPRTSSQS